MNNPSLYRPGSASQIGWAPTTGTPSSNVLTLLAAGHAPGLYNISLIPIITTAGTATVTPTLTWTTQTSGAQSKTVGTFTCATLGTSIRSPASIQSDGSAAITLQFATGAVVGNPVLNVYGSAIPVS